MLLHKVVSLSIDNDAQLLRTTARPTHRPMAGGPILTAHGPRLIAHSSRPNNQVPLRPHEWHHGAMTSGRDNGYKVMSGWRVGHLLEESATRSGLLVPAGSEKSSDALALVDVDSGLQFWAVPTGAWRFLWPATGEVVVAVRESQIIAEQESEHADQENGHYL